MKFRFVGTHTGGRSAITYGGVTFNDTEPENVTDLEWITRLSRHPEFEAVRGRPKGVKND